jgi:N-carbamoylputrescine amidase
MKITVCELNDNRKIFEQDWKELHLYLENIETDLLLLPEMPFNKWLAANKEVSDQLKEESIKEHQIWVKELEDLNTKYVIYSAPELIDGKYFNTAFVFQKEKGHQRIHTKAYFPEEPHFWEESWFDREDSVSFEAFDLGECRIGVLLCTELWFTEKSRDYGKQNVDILLCPRATGKGSVEQWINCGRTSAIISGAYCLSSNRSGIGVNDFQWGGIGWIAEPMTGKLLEISSTERKFVTQEIDLNKTQEAKKDYPLYVKSSF